MKVYVFRIESESLLAPPAYSFSSSLDAKCMNEYVCKILDVTEEEYAFMIEYWDDTLENQGKPEIYYPNTKIEYFNKNGIRI